VHFSRLVLPASRGRLHWQGSRLSLPRELRAGWCCRGRCVWVTGAAIALTGSKGRSTADDAMCRGAVCAPHAAGMDCKAVECGTQTCQCTRQTYQQALLRFISIQAAGGMRACRASTPRRKASNARASADQTSAAAPALSPPASACACCTCASAQAVATCAEQTCVCSWPPVSQRIKTDAS